MSLQETVYTMMEKDSCDPDLAPHLESYVNQQTSDNLYDFEANLALLKLYQFYPEKLNEESVSKILAKALMNTPSSDFFLCLCLIPERLQSEDPIKSLVSAHNALETTNLKEFWNFKNESAAGLLSIVTGFDDAIRTFVIGVVRSTYIRIPCSVLSEYLDLPADQLNAFISENASDWTKIKDDVYSDMYDIPKNSQNQPQPKKFKENINFPDMMPLIRGLTS